MFESLGSIASFGWLGSLVSLNVSLATIERRQGPPDVDAPASTELRALVENELSRQPTDVAAILRTFGREALRGQGAPSAMSSEGQRLLSGDSEALRSRWVSWQKTKRQLSTKELRNTELLKVCDGSARICELRPDGSVRERIPFSDDQPHMGEWTTTEPEGLLRLSIAGGWVLYFIGSRAGPITGFEDDVYFVGALGKSRSNARRSRDFLKFTASHRARIVRLEPDGGAREWDAFSPEEQWPGTWKREGEQLKLITTADGCRYTGLFDVGNTPVWGDEQGVLLDGGGEIWKNRLVMMPL